VGNRGQQCYTPIMALSLYRRHLRIAGACAAGHTPDSRSYESDELRRGWKRCHCPIYTSGTLSGLFARKNTGKIAWPEAKAVVSVWETARAWGEGESIPISAPPVTIAPPGKITVNRAVEAFLASHSETSAPNTQKNYRLLLNKLKDFSASRGYVLIEQWNPLDVREFRSSWGVSPVTASKQMTFLKSFFEFALVNEWVKRNPARLVKDPRGKTDGAERVPFSDEELKRTSALARIDPALLSKTDPGILI